ncbi:MAG: flagellar basal body rod protein FlgC [Phycisphaeraceae bacterium]|nr:MAG: flagellar basal body rod protein FlgC [Phycisphaeraceae bacterium]
MYGSLDISVSGMIAQRTRMDVVAANLANRDTILDAVGNPSEFKRRFVTLAPAGRDAPQGVRVHSIEIDADSEPRKVWDPTNPYAKPSDHPDAGYVYYPNIDPVTEEINAMEAMRSYEANVSAADATKSMLAQALRLIA